MPRRADAGLALVSFLMLLGGSCSCSRPLASDYASPGRDGWVRSDCISLAPGYADSAAVSSGRADVVLSVRLSPEYPFRDLWLEIDESSLLIDPHVDTVHLVADGAGRNVSLRRRRGYVEMEYALRRGIVAGEEYVLSFRHLMKPDTLPGILSFGLNVIPVKETEKHPTI